ncbi:MAG: hypothetical protein JWM46_483 [Candidatus Kaiserbacteria bacterium]|nr:hypothetical protein [Candidatus Kaiserbacteria bacterium]
MESKAQRIWEVVVQICIPFFTILGFLLVSLKQPGYGVISSLASQPFWLYSSYRSWKKADQLGMFINSILATIIFTFGVINYWFI